MSEEITALQKHVSKDLPQFPTLFEKKDSNNQSPILRLLYVGGMAMHHTSESLMAWAALQLILRSRFYELPNVSAIGYVNYGRMQIISGNLTDGYEFGKRGVEINASLGDLKYRCRVLGVFAFYIQPWKRPFDESTSLLTEGMKTGRKSGDLIGLYILKTHLFNLHQGQLGQKSEMQLIYSSKRSTGELLAVGLSGLFLMAYRTKSPIVFNELVSDMDSQSLNH